MEPLKVGELARRTGLTVRTLHHYDEVGLLTPHRRTAAGYRLYGPEELSRLTRILVLRRLGLTLDEVRSWLDDPEMSLERTLDLQIERLRNEIEGSKALLRKLETVAALVREAPDSGSDSRRGLGERLIETVEMMTMYEKHYSAEQLRALEKRAEELGPDRIREVEQQVWPNLIAEGRAAMGRGVDPASDEAAGLAERWMGLVAEFTGGDPGIAKGVRRVWESDDAPRRETGIDAEMFGWIQRADAARKAG
jgi:DNA-binding transcriptional MerR regulator